MSTRKASTSADARGSTLGVQARAQLLEAHVRRHHAKYRLLHTYSHKTRREVVLLGRSSYEMFLLLEAQADQRVIEHLHLEVPGRTGKALALRQVIVTERQQAYTVHVTAGEDAEPNDDRIIDAARREMVLGSKEEVTLCAHAQTDLLKQETLIVNWQRLNAYLYAASTFSLRRYGDEILREMKTGTVRMVSDLMPPSIPSETTALRIAALAELIQTGRVMSDLDVRPFGSRTTLGLAK